MPHGNARAQNFFLRARGVCAGTIPDPRDRPDLMVAHLRHCHFRRPCCRWRSLPARGAFAPLHAAATIKALQPKVSNRQIAKTLGVGKKTVDRDLGQMTQRPGKNASKNKTAGGPNGPNGPQRRQKRQQKQKRWWTKWSATHHRRSGGGDDRAPLILGCRERRDHCFCPRG